MKNVLVAAVLAALGCGSSAQVISAPAGAPVVSAPAGSDCVGQALPAYYLDATNQKVEMSYLVGEGLSRELVDFAVQDPLGLVKEGTSDMVSFAYRYNFGRGVREVYSDYEPTPYISFGVGFGSTELGVLFFTVEDDLTRTQLGFAVPLGENATLSLDGHWITAEDEKIFSDYFDASAMVNFYPAEDMFLGMGYMLNWYDSNGSGDTDYSNLVFRLGYLMGKAETGVELLLQYRQKGENGTDDADNIFKGGIRWHMGAPVSLSVMYEDVSGDLNNDNHSIEIGLWFSPGEGVHIKMGYTIMTLEELTPEKDVDRFSFGVSYAFR